MTYADEADLLNVALFGSTAKEWQINNPKKNWKYERLCYDRRINSNDKSRVC